MVAGWHWSSDPQATLSNEKADNRTANTTRESFIVFLTEVLMVRAIIMVGYRPITK
jgi:hypothetical protein